MKVYIILIFALLVIQGNAFCQSLRETDIPLEVADNFQKKYPDTYVYQWEYKKKEKIYEAAFIIEGNKYEAFFDPDGEWVHTKRSIRREEVPEAVLKSFDGADYGGWEIDSIEEFYTPDHEILYKFEIKNKKGKTDLYFFPTGELEREVPRK